MLLCLLRGHVGARSNLNLNPNPNLNPDPNPNPDPDPNPNPYPNEVSRVANALKARGVKKGDTVTLFMPMVP